MQGVEVMFWEKTTKFVLNDDILKENIENI